ncbi:MAG: hypothetical protein KF874_02575 [Rhizobiaceae bacterium]|nr:hypothetical protein [Rhizobiaceae bacterium]
MIRSAGRSALVLGIVAGLASLVACQKSSQPASSGGKSASLQTMEQVAKSAHKCWFASNDQQFRSYRFANELNSMSGQPRFLLVPAKNYGGLPLLVVQARGASSQVEVFGPLLNEAVGSRINSDIARWSRGDSSCTSSA